MYFSCTVTCISAGHGQSEGNRAYIADFGEYVQDVFHHIDKVKARFPNKPVFLLGHSMVSVA